LTLCVTGETKAYSARRKSAFVPLRHCRNFADPQGFK
jgi:hypothetical protein